MEPISMSTERLRHLLREISERELDYRICTAEDVIGPGGGIYITAQSALEERHLDWIERRNPVAEASAYLDVLILQGESKKSAAIDLELEADAQAPPQENQRQRAEHHSREVVEQARKIAKQAEEVYKSVGKLDFSSADLRQGKAAAGLREFEDRFKAFRGVVRKAIGEYLSGNTLVMDLILKFDLDKRTVRHSLNVAAFATELASQLALGSEGGLDAYFGELDEEQRAELLGAEEEETTEEEEQEQLRRAFEQELVEIFLGGFMHDCGLWNEPYFLQEGHEVKGARLVWELEEVRSYAPSLVKIILFHSDIVRLADRFGVVKVIEDPDDPERTTFKREFYKTGKDARVALEMRPGNFMGQILTPEDLRKVVPVALAERYITQTQNVHAKSRIEVIGDLARYVADGLFARYMVVLCNSQVEVIAPRRAYVKMSGWLTILVDDRKEGRRALKLEVADFEAGSLHHGADRNSPHLVSLFLRRPDGSRDRAEYVAAQDPALWERKAGAESRMYIPVGRFKNNLSIQVTGFISDEVYAKILDEYEQELLRRVDSGR